MKSDTEKIKQAKQRRNDKLAQAVHFLQEAGMIVDIQSSNNKYQIILDEIEVKVVNDGEFEFLIDGYDIAPQLRYVNILASTNNLPLITAAFKPKVFKL